jgi:hypothetical protein
MPRAGKTTARGYGRAYQLARARLLAAGPMCAWCGVRKATTADHDPPMEEVGHPHLNLVPACGPCNFGRRRKMRMSPPSRSW